MTTEDELIQDILECPDNNADRLAYATWLRQHGDKAACERAEIIEIQCRLGVPCADDPEFFCPAPARRGTEVETSRRLVAAAGPSP